VRSSVPRRELPTSGRCVRNGTVVLTRAWAISPQICSKNPSVACHEPRPKPTNSSSLDCRTARRRPPGWGGARQDRRGASRYRDCGAEGRWQAQAGGTVLRETGRLPSENAACGPPTAPLTRRTGRVSKSSSPLPDWPLGPRCASNRRERQSATEWPHDSRTCGSGCDSRRGAALRGVVRSGPVDHRFHAGLSVAKTCAVHRNSVALPPAGRVGQARGPHRGIPGIC